MSELADLEIRIAELREQNARLRRGLLELALTLKRSDPFFALFMEDYGDLLPIR